MTEQPTPPKQLKELQYWFGSIIARPVDMDNNINPHTPSGGTIEQEAAHYILPSLTLEPHQRIEIYNQQYWWRLLGILHETFPLLVRLFGYTDFNATIGFSYLTAHVPDHWSLNQLGDKLPLWIESHYHETDKELVLNAALMDCGYCSSFTAPIYHPLTLDELGHVLDRTLYLQPHCFIYKMNYPFFDFRKEMMTQEPEYWEENDFPNLPKEPTAYILWRDCYSNVGWIQIDPIEASVLSKFKDGISFDALCGWLGKQPKNVSDAATQKLEEWTHRWFVNEWLTTYPPSSSRKNYISI
ncbi:MAG: DNA-binding domain-containing protein [Parachlamydiales bacterium]|jgi:hypothetical protein